MVLAEVMWHLFCLTGCKRFDFFKNKSFQPVWIIFCFWDLPIWGIAPASAS
jgi:hypothetical protein